MEIGGSGTSASSGLINGALIVNGGTFNNAGGVTGPTTVNGGTLNLNLGGSLSTTQRLFVNGGTVNVNSLQVVGGLAGTGGTINVATDAQLILDQLVDTTFAGTFTATGGLGDPYYLRKNGSGTLTLSGNNTGTGARALQVGRGTLQLQGGNAIGDQNIVDLAEGVIRLLDDETIGALFGGLTGLVDVNGRTLTIAGVPGLSGAFDFATLAGGGTLRIASPGFTTDMRGRHSFSGLYQVSAGNLILRERGNEAASVLIDGGTLQVEFPRTFSTVTLASGLLSGGGFVESTGGWEVQSGTISASISGGGLTKTTDGTVTINTNIGLDGPININAGTLVAASRFALGDTRSITVQSGATLRLQDTIAPLGTLTINGTGVGGVGALNHISGRSILRSRLSLGSDATISADQGRLVVGGVETNGFVLTSISSSQIEYGFFIAGTGGFTKRGNGLTIFGFDNSYSGDTTIESGTLLVRSPQVFSDTGRLVVNGGNLIFEASLNEVVGSLEGTGGRIFSTRFDTPIQLTVGGNNLSTTFASQLFTNGSNGEISLVKNGTGTLTLTGVNTYAGGTVINSGTIVAGNASALGTGNVTLNGGGAKLIADFDGTLTPNIVFDNSVVATFAAATGRTVTLKSLALADSSTATFGSATETGTIVWELDSLSIGQRVPVATPAFVIDGGTLRIASSLVQVLTFDALVENVDEFRIGLAGTLDTNGNSLNLRGIAGAGTIANTGAANTLTFSNGSTFAGTFDTGANGITLAGSISGFGNFTKTGAGALTLGSGLDMNGFTGGLTLAGGTLSLQRNLGGTFGTITTTGSVIDYAAGVTSAAPIAINSNTTQLQVLTGTATQSGTISEIGGPRGFEKIGAGRLILSGTNTYTGGTTISAGTLQVSRSANLGGNARNTITINGGTLLVTDGLAINARIGAAGGRITVAGDQFSVASYDTVFDGLLTKTTFGGLSGPLLLFGVGTGNGGVQLDAGVLRLVNPEAMGTGRLTMAEGTRLTLEASETAVGNAITLGGGTGSLIAVSGGPIHDRSSPARSAAAA